MKAIYLNLMIFLSIACHAQINENFSDGNFSSQPEWIGDTNNFEVNSAFELQSTAITAGVYNLFTKSEAIVNAEWTVNFKINYPTSASNYACMYIVCEDANTKDNYNGYFVQIGGANDEVSLYKMQAGKKSKIIDGIDKRTDGKTVEIEVKVKRGRDGYFELYSQLPDETDFVLEGKVYDNSFNRTNYFGLGYANTGTTGKAYVFDNIVVTGDKEEDMTEPEIENIDIVNESEADIQFSEKIQIDNLYLFINRKNIEIKEYALDQYSKKLNLKLNYIFEKGTKYNFQAGGIKDLSDNYLKNEIISTGIIEEADEQDLIINEVMFNHPENGGEYIEIMNRSNKIIDVKGMYISTRKNDGTLNSGNKIENKNLIFPEGYLAFTTQTDSVRLYHDCPQEANISYLNLASLNNSSATIVLCNENKQLIFDELQYDEKWHHAAIKNKKGVALERIHPNLETQNQTSWHSAASTHKHGTPGFKNSQYREIDEQIDVLKSVWVDDSSFSPNNDGYKDLCIINFENENNGYYANIKIFNAEGHLVYTLANNQLLQAKDRITWDGSTQNGLMANAGIYVIYFEAIHPTIKEKIKAKIPIALIF